MTQERSRLSTLARELVLLKRLKEEKNKELSDIEVRMKEIAERDLVKVMDELELDSCSVDGVGTIFIQDATYASVSQKDAVEFCLWLKANGHGDLIKETVHPQTLKAFVREMRSKNEPLPEVCKVTVIPTVRTRATQGD